MNTTTTPLRHARPRHARLILGTIVLMILAGRGSGGLDVVQANANIGVSKERFNSAVTRALRSRVPMRAVSTPPVPFIPRSLASTPVRSRVLAATNRFEFVASAAAVEEVTSAEPPPPPGDPVLLVTSASNPFTSYYTEILRTEGLNAFDAADIGAVDATTLDAYDVVILGEMPLDPGQVTIITNWVTNGGNLIAMRPDKDLYNLLGLAEDVGTLSNAYVLFNTTSGPAVGLVNETIQFHGDADRATVTAAGQAAVLATLFSDADTLTGSPAVTLRSVGDNGGQAAAFLFDLAKSIVYTRQGNPAWSGEDRDGAPPIRSNDLFFGVDPDPDWVDLNKVAIPQADEQQRLLANLILHVEADTKPLPRFWYFPRGEKAVVIMTGDDHATGGTAERFEQYKLLSEPGCSVEDWGCVRSTSYIYTDTPLSNQDAAAYDAEGFEIGLHLKTSLQVECADYTPSVLANLYSTQLSAFAAQYQNVPAQTTHRTHCIVWSDYATQPKVEFNNGIRFDTNYYYFPPGWVADQPGMFTGSGMPMRFADVDGTLIDVYQATTQMTDESAQSYPATVDALLDKALGPEGFYGAFTANMHTDYNDVDDVRHSMESSNAIVASAQARGVPVVSSRQMLEWLDGRNASTFDGIDWDGTVLAFTVTAGAGSNGLQAMVPARSGTKVITGVMRNGTTTVPYAIETIKGVQYAIFSANAGSHEATYEAILDTTPAVISNVAVQSITTSTAVITWNTDEPATSSIDYGTSAGTLVGGPANSALLMSHSLTLTNLVADTGYYFRVQSDNLAGLGATSPTPPDLPATFTTLGAAPAPSGQFVDTTVADFRTGTATLAGGAVLGQTADGEVMLAFGEEFSGTLLPSGWSSHQWSGAGSANVANGKVTVDGARVNFNSFFAAPVPGTTLSLEIVATFEGDSNQHIGFGDQLAAFSEPWAIFSTQAGGGLWAVTNVPNTPSTSTQILPTPAAGSHRFRIDWSANQIVYSIDGTVVATHALVLGLRMRPIAASDFAAFGGRVVVDSVAVNPEQIGPGLFTSRIYDAGAATNWRTLSAVSAVPANTGLILSVRTGNTPTPDGAWTAFIPVPQGGNIGRFARFIQYRAQFASNNPALSPRLDSVGIAFGSSPAGTDVTAPVISGVTTIVTSPTTATVTWTTDEPADSLVSYIGSTAPAGAQGSAALVTSHSVKLTGLTDNHTYSYTVTSVDAASNSATATPVPATFLTPAVPAAQLIDTTTADFTAGAPGAATYVATTAGGEVILKPAEGSEFSEGPAVPAGWSTHVWNPGGGASVAGGLLNVDGARVNTTPAPSQGPGSSVEFAATFGTAILQAAGFGNTLSTFAEPWAIFGTLDLGNSTQLFARTNTLVSGGSVSADTPLAGPWLGSSHRYRIDWETDKVVFSIDGTIVHTEHTGIAAAMRPVAASDFISGGGASGLISVDWIRVTPYAAAGTFVSRVLDGGTASVDWADLNWTSDTPDGTSLLLRVRTGDTATPDGTWSEWSDPPVSTSGVPITGSSRYIQYAAEFTGAGAGKFTPVLKDVRVGYFPFVPENDEPVANAGPGYTINEDADAVVAAPGVLADDTDANGDLLTAILVSRPAHGSIVLNGDGSFTYGPHANHFGSDAFSYKVNDGKADSNVATVTITITPVNDNPVTIADIAVVSEDSADNVIDVVANDSTGPDSGETLALESASAMSTHGGAVVAHTSGTHAGKVTYTPVPNFFGADSFSYAISDGNGGTAIGTVSVNVTPVNDPPAGADDTATVDEDSAASAIDVLANDSFGPDAGETLTVTSFTLATNGEVTITPGGSSLTYTPAADFFGIDSFTYMVSDGNGGTDTATVTVTVNNLNDDPSAAGDTATVNEDSDANVIAVLANDSFAPDAGETLTIINVAEGDHGQVAITANGTTVTYTPNPNYFGTDVFGYTISDGNGGEASALVTVTIANGNDAPVARDDNGVLVAEDSGANAIAVLANDDDDVDEDETLVVTAVTQGANGTVTFTATDVSYTPNAQFFGTDSFTYTIGDGNGGSATGTVNLTVTNVNDNPVAVDDNGVVVAEDSGATAIAVLANDNDGVDEGETLIITAVTQGGDGTVTFSATEVSYTPNAQFFGADSFTYTISDGNGGTATATVNLTVTSLNDDPIATDDTATVAEDSGANAINVLSNDTDGPDSGETLTITGTTNGANGIVVITGGGTAVSYTPNANFSGGDSFTYTISDGNAGSATATVNVTVTAVNDDPVAMDDARTVAEDSGATVVDVRSNDTIAPDTGETLSVTAVTQGSNGVVAITGGGTEVSYTPNAHFFGGDSFTYTISDGNGGTDTATVTMTVTAVNDVPSFTAGANQTVGEGSGAQSVTAWATAISAGPANEAGQAVDFVVSNNNNPLFEIQPAVAANGTLTYTLAAGMSGTATVLVQIHDNGGTTGGGVDTSATQSFTITVNPRTATVTNPPTSTLNPSTYGQSVTFTATVTGNGGTPTGTVTFYDNGTALGTVALSAGSASFTASTATTLVQAGVPAGTPRSITATYNGNTQFAPSTSTALGQTVNKASSASTLTVSPTLRQYSDLVTVENAMTTVNGQLPAESVTFKVGTQVLGTAPVTLVGGVPKAILSNVPLLEPTPWGTAPTGQMKPLPTPKSVTVVINNPSPNFNTPAASPKGLTINKDDARTAYTGNVQVSTSGPTVATATVQLRATVKDISATPDAGTDTSPGDIRNATVTFINRDTGLVISSAIPVTLLDSGETRIGEVVYNWAFNLNSLNTQTVRVGMRVDNYYTRDSSSEDTLVTVSRGIATGFSTGAGSLTLATSGGLMPGVAGSTNTFGFGVSYTGGGSSPVGHFNTMLRSGTSTYHVKATSYSSLVVVGKTATLQGPATIYNVTTGSTVVDSAATFQVTINDVDAGGNDRISIQVKNGAGAVWFSSNWNGSATLDQILAGGNIKLP